MVSRLAYVAQIMLIFIMAEKSTYRGRAVLYFLLYEVRFLLTKKNVVFFVGLFGESIRI